MRILPLMNEYKENIQSKVTKYFVKKSIFIFDTLKYLLALSI